MREFTSADVKDDTLCATKDELHYDPPWWLEQGLQETISGYGSKLNSGYRIKYNGRLYRVYVTQYSNAGTAWFLVKGQKIFIR